MANAPKIDPSNIDAAVMARLRAPFGCEYVQSPSGKARWRIHDANDDAIATVSYAEEGYARLIVQALNEHYTGRAQRELSENIERNEQTSG